MAYSSVYFAPLYFKPRLALITFRMANCGIDFVSFDFEPRQPMIPIWMMHCRIDFTHTISPHLLQLPSSSKSTYHLASLSMSHHVTMRIPFTAHIIADSHTIKSPLILLDHCFFPSSLF